MQDRYEKLINDLIYNHYLKTEKIITAFRKINRRDFVLPQYQDKYEANSPLPIGHGQTISQPLTVAFMLELLQPQPGDRVLDIGCGSGWTTALLSQIVGNKGKVFGVEVLPELCSLSRNNLAKYDFIKTGVAEIICADGREGLPDQAPFDRILVSDAARDIPPALKEQLKIGGRLVMPVGDIGRSQTIIQLEKEGLGKFLEQQYPGFVFVPLI